MIRIAGLLILLLPGTSAGDEFAINRPVRCAVSEDDQHVYIAGGHTGVVSAVDATSGKLLFQARVGRRLADLACVPGTTRLLAVDSGSNELLELAVRDDSISAQRRIPVVRGTRIAVNDAGTLAAMTCRWPHTVHILQTATMTILHTVQLNFAPQEVIRVGPNQFVVAAAFGGDLVVVGDDGQIHHRHQLRGHNIRGLLVSGDEILIAHQILSQLAHTEFADVHWGTLMQNVVSRAPLSRLRSQNLSAGRIAIGDVGSGSADPGSMALLPDGRVAVALSGVDQVLLSDIPDDNGRFRFAGGERFETGSHPVHVAASRAGRLYVANSLGDSVTIRHSDGRRTTMKAEPEEHLSAAQRGERAFYSGRLSHDGWLSCHSCHSDGHRIELKADTLGDGAFGNPKVIPSLLGVADTGPWGWSGDFDRLEDQIRKSVKTTMHGEPDAAVISDLVAFLQTLRPPPAKSVSADLVTAGKAVFLKHDCAQCHGQHYTSNQTFDVGFRDELGQTRFNPPSLRGVRQRRLFFHDGRTQSLDAALELHSQNLNKTITPPDRRLLRSFLLSL